MAYKGTTGVLALQGDFQEHLNVLDSMGVKTALVKLPEDLKHVDRLIIPGGESTTIGKLMDMYGLITPIRDRIKSGMPVWGTCAGAILLAKNIADGITGQPKIGVMDITARRNAFGRQLDSFEHKILMPDVSKKPIPVAFIRAPIFEKLGKRVETLGTVDGHVVAARQGKMLVTAFHPELKGSRELHEYFLSL